ncbi:hypothetical protein [Polynucleobacter necessarius]|uniref:hypothetical protein n=1 Tax=Polynucleobacter necessarius TaxID=576610 RepID=UPI000E08E6DB|nr:hypothetical protein [Polynucleobacter necessarius]
MAWLRPPKHQNPSFKKIASEVKHILELPSVKERFDELGTTAVSSTPDQFDKLIATGVIEFSRLAKLSGIKSE